MAGIAERLQIVIDANTGNAARDILKAGSAADSLAVSEDKASVATAKLSRAYAQQAVDAAKLTKDTVGLKAAQEDLKIKTTELALANDKLKISSLEAGEAGASMGSKIAAGLAKAGPAIAAVGISKLLFDGVKGSQDLALAVQKFQAVAGGTTQQASLLVGQVKALGVEPEVAMKAFQRFGAAIGDGTSKLSTFGVQVAHNKDGTNDLIGTFDNLRRAYQSTTDGAERDAIAKQLSLRAGTALVPLLSATAEQIKAINAETKRRGGFLTPEDEQHAIALKIASNEMAAAFKGAEISIAKGFIPILTTAAGIVTHIADVVTGLNKWGGIRIDGNGIGFSEGKGDGTAAATAKAEVDAKAAADRITANDATVASEDRLNNSINGEISAQKALRDSQRASADAVTNLATATDEYDKLLKHGAVDEKAVASARKELDSATREMTRALEGEQKAQDRLNKARERASALDLEEAANKVALAGDEVGTRKADVGKAQEELDKLQGSGAASPDEIAAAQAKVKKANDEVTAAVDNVGRAQEAQQKVAQKGTDMDPAVISALDGVKTAHENVQTAVEREAGAEDKMRTAQAGDPDFADKLAKARQKVADAHSHIADAQDAQAIAAENLKTKTDVLNKTLGEEAGHLGDIVANILALAKSGIGGDAISRLLGAIPAANLAATVAPGSPFPGPDNAVGPYSGPTSGPLPVPSGTAPGAAAPYGTHPNDPYPNGYPAPNVTVNATTGATAPDIARELAWSLATLPPSAMAVP